MTAGRLLAAARRRLRRMRHVFARRPAGPNAPVTDLPAASAATADLRHLVFLIVIDGLRPDSIDPVTTPNISRLAKRGVSFADAHAVFPSDTRVNAAAIATGTYPGTNGVVGNSMVLRDLEGEASLVTLRHDDLLRAERSLNSPLLLADGLGQVLARHGRRLAAASSASTGSALLLNREAIEGVGVLVNGAFEPGAVVAYPQDVNEAILRRFGPAPRKMGHGKPRADLVGWTQRVLMEFVVPELAPDVVIDWITEPDHQQHAYGVGSPQARQALSNVDGWVGYVLRCLEQLGLADRTDVLIVSDHGATRFDGGVDVQEALAEALLGEEASSPEVTVLPNGAGAQILCDPALVADIVSWLQRQEWAGPIFTAPARPQGRTPGDGMSPYGCVDGTFSMDFVHLFCARRSPDVIVTLRWDSRPNEFGIPGAGPAARASAMHSGHGSISPWVMKTTMLGSGPSLREGSVVRTPVSQVDLMPTILHLQGIDDVDSMDGRVLYEALRGANGRGDPAFDRRTVTAASADGAYRAALQVSSVGRYRYLDTGWRTEDGG
jgi:arylsulfatase A-like enzyme